MVASKPIGVLCKADEDEGVTKKYLRSLLLFFFTEGIKSEMNPDFVAVMHEIGLFTDPIRILWKKGLIL